MIRVAYDAAVLGAGHYNPRGRTGVFRVTENIALQLLAHPDECELTFCASRNRTETAMFLESCDHFRGARFLLSRPWTEVYKVWRGLDTRIGSAGSGLRRFALRWMRFALTHASAKLLSPVSGMDPEVLRRIDIYHSPFYPFDRQARGAAHIKKFLTVYDLIPILFPHFFGSREGGMLKEAFSHVSRDGWALCISQSTKNDLCNYLKDFDPSRAFVTHLGVSEDFYPCTDPGKIASARAKYAIPDAPYVLTLSTLEPRKNIHHVIRCFAKTVLGEKIDDLCLVLVGAKGWDYGRAFEELAQYPALRKRIILTGYVDFEDLAPLYSGALAFVYPSLYEGFGLPPLEAMKCGTPVITSNTSSLPEVVGDAGTMVSPTDEDALCHAILEILRDSALRARMSERSLARAALFSWEKCVRDTINAYKLALSS
jgi:glycosyltransferase involved in cell wall biosynthesis